MIVVDPATVAPRQYGWAELSVAMHDCFACPLSQSRTRVVPGVFPPRARVLLVGEAPGRSEDEGGLPFIGRSGQLLDSLLAEVGLERADLAVLNTVKCRPPGNRPPTRAESATCRGWTERQLALARPDVMVALGLSAAKWFLGPRTVLAQVRARPHQIDGRAVWATYHPSAAIRFGPNGAPRAGLLADLTAVAGTLA